jgi:hypothetical protein
LPKKGDGAVGFLTGYFVVLGLEIQNWMLIAAGIVVAFVIFVLVTRDRG